MGVNLTALLTAISSGSVPGVSDGTQNEGREDLVDSDCSVSGTQGDILAREERKIPFLFSTHPSFYPLLL